MDIGDRKRNILETIINIYIKTGEPVGSKVLSDELYFSISPATIRNEMAELEQLGFLSQLHASSGRIPTQQGYREYVNNLMRLEPISEKEKRYIYGNLFSQANEPDRLLERASQLLASLTNFVVVSSAPSDYEAMVRHIQFIITGRCASMIIMMTSSGMIKSKNFRVDYTVTPEILRVYQGIFNNNFAGVPISIITPEFIQDRLKNLGEIKDLLKAPILAFVSVCKEAMETDINLKGQTNLLYIKGFDIESAKKILDFLNNEENVSKLLNNISDDNIKVLIGKENKEPELINSSVVIAKYDLGNKKDSGTLAIIGPTRMDYPKMITSLTYFADALGDILSDMLYLDTQDN